MICPKTILVLCFAALFAQRADMPPTPVARQTEEFALKARREGHVGLPIPIPPDLFAKVTETISVYPTICDAPHRASLPAYRLPYEFKGPETFAVQGRGYCYCSWAGNCRFWIYRKHRSKYQKLFEADNVQAFAFLPARGNLPFLFLWTRNSAVRFSVRVLEFNGAEYHDSDGWIEQYQYEDEDGEFSVHDVPRILKRSFPEEPPA
ncbi:MAG TPA: hypothetical protein VGF61_07510 [Candidatus Acidoferrum sp.]|jgi:hypothetical protein